MAEHEFDASPETQQNLADVGVVAHELANISEWRQTDVGDYDTERSVTWARYPCRYVLTEYGRNMGRFRKTVVPAASVVESLSAKLVDTGMCQLKRYYVAGGECVAITFHELPDVSEISHEDAAMLASELDFAIEHELLAANEQDKLELEYILKQAQQDGVESYSV